jgi:hypothetical protein
VAAGFLGGSSFRDYLAYVLISVGLVGIVLPIALYEARKTRRLGTSDSYCKIAIALIDQGF